jgi:ElaB/YqjD/DUF883 family membrane-anchored ribosome-binding protein
MTTTAHLEAAAENIASDVRDALASREFDSVPQIKALRQRVDSKLAIARELAAEKSRVATRKAREAAHAADVYAHEEPWKVAGAALAAGVLLGLLIGRR